MTGKALRVFVIEDDADLRSALVFALEAAGHEVTEAADGECALEMLAAAADRLAPTPDVVLIDVRMPKLSGFGILRALKWFHPSPRAILMTGLMDGSVDVLARRLGATTVLRKPFSLDAMCAEIERVGRGVAPAPVSATVPVAEPSDSELRATRRCGPDSAR